MEKKKQNNLNYKFLDKNEDPDQTAPSGAVGSVSSLFAISIASFGGITS